MRVVVDTNVLVSGVLLPDSVPGQVFDRVHLEGNLLFSHETFTALREVLHRPKFDRYLDVPKRNTFLARCSDAAILIEVVRSVHACRDSSDDKFLDAIVNGRADALVTGDADLLVLGPFEGIPILTPIDWLAKVGASPGAT